MKGFIHIVVVICLQTVPKCFSSQPEPACSKFDYEEKLLAKTIRLENTVDDLSKAVAKVQAELTESQTDRKEMRLELDNLKDEVEKQNAIVLEIEAHCQANKREIDVELGTLKDVDEKQNATIAALEGGVGELTMKMKNYETESVLRPVKCPSTYMYHAELNLCWRLEKDKQLDWLSAGWQCITEGGHLLIPDSIAKIKMMQYFLVTSAIGINTLWVGGTDGMAEGKYKWINGQPVGTLPWGGSSEPTGNTDQNCILMEGANKYDFYDRSCTPHYNFLCEISI